MYSPNIQIRRCTRLTKDRAWGTVTTRARICTYNHIKDTIIIFQYQLIVCRNTATFPGEGQTRYSSLNDQLEPLSLGGRSQGVGGEGWRV